MNRWHSAEHKAELQYAMKHQLSPHVWVASWYFGVPYERVTPDQRHEAKRQNYIYLCMAEAR